MLKAGVKLCLILALSAGLVFATENISVKLQNEYTKIASSFVKQSAKELFPSWRDTNVTKLTPFYSVNNHLIAFEATLAKSYDKNRSEGYLFITIPKDKPLINTFSATGNSISNILLKYWNDNYAKLCKEQDLRIEDFKFLIALPSSYAIGVKFSGTAEFLENIPEQNGYYIFTPFPQSRYVNYIFEKKRQTRGLGKKPIHPAKENEREALKKALLNEDYNNTLFKIEDKGKIKRKKQTRDMNSVRGTFAPFYQEYRYWNDKDTTASYAGCAPVAWAILYEYWDERGYPKLLGSQYNNIHKTPIDEDVRKMISKLRIYMNAHTVFYKGSYLTGVSNDDVPKGIIYANERGYNFSAFNEWTNHGWNGLKNEINNNRPALISYFSNGLGHTAVAYRYIDMSGSQNDIFCVRTGWKYPNPLTECQNKYYAKVVTIVHPETTEQPTVKKITKYGAVAVSIANPILITIGATWNTTSLEYAKQQALQNCQAKISTGCKLLKTIENSCLAIAQVPYQAKGSYAVASNITDAQNQARNSCNKYTGRNDCFTRFAFCSKKSGYVAHNNPARENKPTPPKPHVNPTTDKSDEYAAIAMSVRNGRLIRWGRSWHKSSLYEAKKAALEGCAYSDCKVIAFVKNYCVSVAKVKNQNRGSYYRAYSYNAAKYGALRNCNNRGFGECKSVTTVCAYGQ